MITIRFEVYLQEPLLATAVEGDPNSAVSLPYIPGSLIRGALVNRYLQSNPTDDLAIDPRARRLFFSGETRYLNVYPADNGGERTLPTPSSWYKEKGAGDEFTAYDLSIEEPDEDTLSHPVRVERPFCTLDDDGATLYKPAKQITVHTQRDRVMGRATEGSGAVFQYESLSPGQTFVGLVFCPDPDAADTIEQLLQEQDILLGGSRSAGYGFAEIRKVRRESSDWQVPEQDTEAIQGGDTFSLILLSDAILRDENGHYTGFLTPEILQTCLDAPLTLLKDHTFARSGVVGGFNRKWGLPLPQVHVARAGSVYTFRAEDAIPKDKLSALFEVGIGERCVDGFGRVAIHWNQAETVKVKKPANGRLPSVTLADSGTSAALARRMATRMLRRSLDAQLTQRIDKLSIKGDIKNNQLSSVRVLVRSAWLDGNVQPILDHLKEMKDTARKQFDTAMVGSTTLNQWLQTILTEPQQKVWERLYQSPLRQEKLPAIGGINAEWDEKLAREYALRLIDGVLSRTLERRRVGK